MLTTLLLMGVQAGAAGPVLPAPRPARPASECASDGGDGGDVVVCGRIDQEQFRLRPLPERYRDDTVPRAELGLPGGAKLSTETEAVGVGGFQSNRVMLRFKVPL